MKTIGESCDVVFLMSGYPQDVKETADVIIPLMKPGSFLVDDTTSSPDLAESIANECEKRGIHCWDAPVSGGDIGAREARLVVMVGGKEEGFETVKNIMQ